MDGRISVGLPRGQYWRLGWFLSWKDAQQLARPAHPTLAELTELSLAPVEEVWPSYEPAQREASRFISS